MIPPRATYRLQFRSAFGFKEAAAIAPYLARLGVSHVYLSPFFKARPGSLHGYDITDHARLNLELGSEEDYSSMIEAFRREGLNAILDFVPNHMGVGGADNPIWLDVLEWGPESRYAGWFDIDWGAGGGKLLAPVLGGQYGEELREGKLSLRFGDDGTFAIWAYGEHELPVCPLTYPMVLGHGAAAVDRMSDRFLDLPNWRPQTAERALGLKAELADLAVRDARTRREIDERVAAINRDWREMDRLIAGQFWRVAFFRVAEDEINYRRFFNINDLAGLRMELEPVFEHAHARVLRMLEAREIDGLRIDHVDGLLDPKSYLTALRERVDCPFYLVVEKILAPHERLRADWPVEGTTGYDYLNFSLGLLVDQSAEGAFSETYRAFAGAGEPFEEIALASKLRVMDNEMASEVGALGRAAVRLARESPMTADLTQSLLTRAIKAIVGCFPVYRTYVDLSGAFAEADRRDIAWAFARARRSDPDVHSSAFDFLEGVLTGETRGSAATEISRTAALRFAMKLQQFSGPVMAKGVEDTAFYRYNRFVGLNEVGGAPDRFGIPPALFHKANAQRAERWPHAMLATATHDTKRGEDARARLAVLSEVPEEWRRQVTSWSRLLRARLGDVEGRAPPARDDEYMLYQMLVGSWPTEMLETPTAEGLEAYRTRIRIALEKALREGKQRSNWAAPNLEYEAAMQAFAAEALRPDGGFLTSFLPFVERIARLGVQNSLVQTALKLMAPGVPDIYQGCELWDLSLVDPDNRRAVDYREREGALAKLAPRLEREEDRAVLFESLLMTWRDGRVKLAVTALLLSLRRDCAELFASGDYQPIEMTGENADWVVGFVRTFAERRLAVLAARFPARREGKPDWRARARMPEGEWFDVIRARPFRASTPLSEWLGLLPFAILKQA
ncbi:MAG TPA: malto-oligosyltrehalose synthase [Roseiarcus sp.]|nr:malto-oligosyltrehalose synthase [Roseiarcus sp.]